MKIYEYIQIDIDTGEVIEEVSYDYTGPVAQCGKGGGDISYESSPEQAQLFKLLQPLIEGVSEYGMHNICLLYTSPSPRDATLSRMPSSA